MSYFNVLLVDAETVNSDVLNLVCIAEVPKRSVSIPAYLDSMSIQVHGKSVSGIAPYVRYRSKVDVS